MYVEGMSHNVPKRLTEKWLTTYIEKCNKKLKEFGVPRRFAVAPRYEWCGIDELNIYGSDAVRTIETGTPRECYETFQKLCLDDERRVLPADTERFCLFEVDRDPGRFNLLIGLGVGRVYVSIDTDRNIVVSCSAERLEPNKNIQQFKIIGE